MTKHQWLTFGLGFLTGFFVAVGFFWRNMLFNGIVLGFVLGFFGLALLVWHFRRSAPVDGPPDGGSK